MKRKNQQFLLPEQRMVHTEKFNVKHKAQNLGQQEHPLPELYASGGDEIIPTLPSLDKSLLM